MLRCPFLRRVLIAKLPRAAMWAGPWPVRIFEASSANAVSRTWWWASMCV